MEHRRDVAELAQSALPSAAGVRALVEELERDHVPRYGGVLRAVHVTERAGADPRLDHVAPTDAHARDQAGDVVGFGELLPDRARDVEGERLENDRLEWLGAPSSRELLGSLRRGAHRLEHVIDLGVDDERDLGGA